MEDMVSSIIGKVVIVFSEEDGNRVFFEEFDLIIVIGFLYVVFVVLGVDVVILEVDSVFFFIVVEVVCNFSMDVFVIVGSIIDVYLVVVFVFDVGFGIMDGGFDVGGGFSVGFVVVDFVVGEEINDVGVLG